MVLPYLTQAPTKTSPIQSSSTDVLPKETDLSFLTDIKIVCDPSVEQCKNYSKEFITSNINEDPTYLFKGISAGTPCPSGYSKSGEPLYGYESMMFQGNNIGNTSDKIYLCYKKEQPSSSDSETNKKFYNTLILTPEVDTSQYSINNDGRKRLTGNLNKQSGDENRRFLLGQTNSVLGGKLITSVGVSKGTGSIPSNYITSKNESTKTAGCNPNNWMAISEVWGGGTSDINKGSGNIAWNTICYNYVDLGKESHLEKICTNEKSLNLYSCRDYFTRNPTDSRTGVVKSYCSKNEHKNEQFCACVNAQNDPQVTELLKAIDESEYKNIIPMDRYECLCNKCLAPNVTETENSPYKSSSMLATCPDSNICIIKNTQSNLNNSSVNFGTLNQLCTFSKEDIGGGGTTTTTPNTTTEQISSSSSSLWISIIGIVLCIMFLLSSFLIMFM